MKHIKNFKNVLNMLCIANRTFIYLFFNFFLQHRNLFTHEQTFVYNTCFLFCFFCNFFLNTLLTIKHTEHYISWLQGNIAWLTNNT